ncbi:hypothetical protein [Rhizobium phaseoli]|uniref:hypothetical protein n=1 Tax=Rhizobium phaseoli TaxID=396 RepID=UPI001CEDE244|nr:hypothetical protein [Rhizobium phaseoli]MDK4730472.1 hypothetical protein [Rhizobium phaseoli]
MPQIAIARQTQSLSQPDKVHRLNIGSPCYLPHRIKWNFVGIVDDVMGRIDHLPRQFDAYRLNLIDQLWSGHMPSLDHQHFRAPKPDLSSPGTPGDLTKNFRVS